MAPRDAGDPIARLPAAPAGKAAYVVRGQRFELAERYRPLRVVGAGVYGVVLAARDDVSGNLVAIKKIAGVFDDLVDAKRILREIRLMRTLAHENILSVCDMEDPESLDFTDIYIYSPLFDNDLSSVISSKIGLSDSHVKYFLYQLLCGLKYIHSGSVLHRDVKPANCLVSNNCDLALCDFGLARYVDTNQAVNVMTEYVVTRWYRPPELALSPGYTAAVDLWGAGCIFAQLLGRRPLFPGRDFKHQVQVICSVIGKPTEEQMAHIGSPRARAFLAKLPDTAPVDFSKRFPDASPEAIDLLEKLLKFSPADRISAEDALKHPYLQEYHDPHFETEVSEDFDAGDLEPCGDDGAALTREDLSRLLLSEIAHFRPQAARLLKA